jgi:saccharopine dehydrogenase-like NADP-dependent oxidoreductase
MSHIPDMKEKTLRYPGHINLIMALRDGGFFGKEPVAVNGTDVIPLDFTSGILFKAWKLGEEEPEFTVMRIRIRGTEEGVAREITYDLYDEYDPEEKVSSMARTTGFTATGTAEMILNGIFTEKGVFPPELVGRNAQCFEFIISYLHDRNIHYRAISRNI